ncbi:adenylyltransferase/cytidyltransferase family protein, partial [Escherichia coli]|nr:adenylyltransferase/cytidyltransferase family protein [Escherichia coli]
LTNGCFDLLHVGHIRYLQGAAAIGDILITAINSDKQVKSLKGPGRPAIPEKERAELIAAIRYVDYVTIFDEPTVADLILA